ncbi:FbpB family small basic protein [Thalassobacillus sp. CUG 92003]|nr:FbpB family small basic protein [Thalassobacillus sp. CUG 92003]
MKKKTPSFEQLVQDNIRQIEQDQKLMEEIDDRIDNRHNKDIS